MGNFLLRVIILTFFWNSLVLRGKVEKCSCSEKIKEIKLALSNNKLNIIYYLSKSDCFHCGIDDYILKKYSLGKNNINKIVIFEDKLNVKESEFFRKKYNVAIITDENKILKSFLSITETPTILVYSKNSIEIFRFSRKKIFNRDFLMKFEDALSEYSSQFKLPLETINLSANNILNVLHSTLSNGKIYIIDDLQNILFIFNKQNGELIKGIKPFSIVDTSKITFTKKYPSILNKIKPMLSNVFIIEDTIVLLCRQYIPKLHQKDSIFEITLFPKIYLQKIFFDSAKDSIISLLDTTSLPNTRNLIISKNILCFYNPFCKAAVCSFDTTGVLYVKKDSITRPIIKSEDLFQKGGVLSAKDFIPNFIPKFFMNETGNGVLISELNRYCVGFKIDTNSLLVREKHQINPHGFLLELFCYWDSLNPTFDFFVENSNVNTSSNIAIEGIFADEERILILLRIKMGDSFSYVIQSYKTHFYKEILLAQCEKYETVHFIGKDSTHFVFLGKTGNGDLQLMLLEKRYLE